MMTHSITVEALATLGAPRLVYVRPVKAQDVLGDDASQTLAELHLQPDQMLYALHGADGARLAVLADRDSAYAAAMVHELALVSVH